MNFIIQLFACVVVVSAKCLTQGLEDSKLSPQGQKWCWGALVSHLCPWAYGSLTPCFQLSIHKPGPADLWPGLRGGH